MYKKIGLAAVLAVGGLFLLNTTYAGLGWKKAKTFFTKQISPETKLEMIKEQVAQLNKESTRYVSEVAKATVEVRSLKREIADAEVNQKKQFDLILVMRKDLESGEPYLVYDGDKYPRERVERKLNKDWESYKRGQDQLAQRKQTLEARERALTAAEERLKEFKAKREELDTEVAQLETELKNVQLAQSQSNLNFDDSKVGEVRQQIADFKKYLEEERVKSELEGKYTSDPIPVGKKGLTKEGTMKEIDDYVKQQGGKTDAKAQAPVDESAKTAEK